MKKIVIAEKPSLSRKIMEALESDGQKFKRMDGGEYFISDGYAVTAQFGHMLELKDLSSYKENEGKDMWRASNLPFFPSKYEYVMKGDVAKRYETIRMLLNDTEHYDEVIHCGDPDREGQILVDIVLADIGVKMPVTRPILKTLTNEAILKAFDERKSNREFINWHNEGMVRMYIDYDFGLNLSRYATDKTMANPALNVGRVKGAIANEIYEREMAIRNFVPELYYKVESNVDGVKLTSKKEFDKNQKDEAEAYAKVLNDADTVVKKVTRRNTEKKRPKLFSQTDLQSRMNKLYNMSPDQTLALSQSLYEKGYISYPRTNTEYMTTGEKDEVKKIIDAHNEKGLMKFRGDKTVFDDSKIDGHSAITPTTKHVPQAGLTEDERKCYQTIALRFMAVFCREDCIYDRTQVQIENKAGEEFKVSGEVLVSAGWQQFEKPDKKDNILPEMKEGDLLTTDFQAVEGKTQAPKHYTVDTLGKWMQNPFRKEINEKSDEDDDDTEMYKNILKGLEIGTEATRSGILNTLIQKKYISLDKKAYGILPRGEFLVNSCRRLGIDMSKEATARLGSHTKAVYNGEVKMAEVVNEVRREIWEVIRADKETIFDRAEYGSRTDSLGTCPLCGAPVVANSKAFGCSAWRSRNCGFTIWRTMSGAEISVDAARKLLEDGYTDEIQGFRSRSGKEFSARLVLDGAGKISFGDVKDMGQK